MRVSDSILNRTAAESGLPVNGTLLDASGGNDALLQALDKKKAAYEDTSVTTASKELYGKLRKSADRMKEAADLLASGDAEGLFEKAAESGDLSGVREAVKDMTAAFNETYEGLKKTGSMLDLNYAAMLKEAFLEGQDALQRAGVTMKNDGLLSVDEEKLNAAEFSTLKAAFGTDGLFSGKVASAAKYIASNAEAGTESLSSVYGRNGDPFTAAAGVSTFDFWG